ncbi:hypothetical protein C8F04DRAFT_961386, partial [Mycena alexandri]
YDITHGFGFKWKKLFHELEANHGLVPMLPAHIWLLHHLFLPRINDNTQEWAQAWNLHDLQICSKGKRSPRDIFFFSMLQDGPRSLERITAPVDKQVEHPMTYGIDWDVADNPTLMHHHLLQHLQEWEDHNPFAPGLETLSKVPCDAPDSSVEQIEYLDRKLVVVIDTTSCSMNMRKLVWQEAFRICNTLYQ